MSKVIRVGIVLTIGVISLLLPLGSAAEEPELCVDPNAPIAELFKAAESAVSRVEKMQPETFKHSKSPRWAYSSWREIVYLDQQLLHFIMLEQGSGPECLELKWRQYGAGCREKRILILLLHWNYLPDNLDEMQPEGNLRYGDLSAWNPESKECKARREEIEYVRQNGRATHERLRAMLKECKD